MTDEARGTEEPGGYVHDPSTFEEPRGDDPGEQRDRRGDATAGSATAEGATQDREFGWRGWVLVGSLLVAFLVVPTALYYVPRAQGFVTSLGLSLRDAYLVLPLVPALLLGALAVWATTRP